MIDAPAPTRRGRFDALVAAQQPLCRDHYRLTVRIASPEAFCASQPGQFVQVLCHGPNPSDLEDRLLTWPTGDVPRFQRRELVEASPFLRRPFSIAGRRQTPNGTELDIIYRVVGLGTGWLQRMQVGDRVSLIGPLGNAFTLPPDRSIGLLVGGGVGLPPMFYLAEALAQAGWSGCAFVGATTADLLAMTMTAAPPADGQPAHTAAEFADLGLPVVVTTDDGSCGMRGLITDGLRVFLKAQPAAQRPQTVVFTCGPMAMMKAAADLAHQFDIECQVCTEQSMACGMGTCQSCVVRVRDAAAPHGRTSDGIEWRYRLGCTDGPVFSAADLVW